MSEILLVCRGQDYPALAAEFQAQDFSVRLSDQIDGLLEAAKARLPHFLILDFDLSDNPPWDVLAAWRLDPDTGRLPFLIMTGRHTGARTMVSALRLGAVEYLLKPIDPRVLVARVQALLAALERRRRAAPLGTLRSSDNLLTLDVKAHRCFVGLSGRSKEVRLTPKEFTLLTCLMARPGNLVTKEELLRLLWPSSVNSSEEDANTLAQHIAHLRRKLGAANKSLKTVWGIGYRFG